MDGRILLAVRGHKEDAEKAAAQRSVPFVFNRESVSASFETDVISFGYTETENEPAVQAWYMEPRPQDDEPLPDGTLLYYRVAGS